MPRSHPVEAALIIDDTLSEDEETESGTDERLKDAMKKCKIWEPFCTTNIPYKWYKHF